MREPFGTFVATLLGVLLAFSLNDLWFKHTSSKGTYARIEILDVECQSNVRHALEAIKAYGEPITNTTSQKVSLVLYRLTESAAQGLLSDPNVYRVMKPHEILALVGYADAITTYNQAAGMSHDAVMNHGTPQNVSSLRESTKVNAAVVVANCFALRQALVKYVSDNVDLVALAQEEEILNSVKDAALQGRVDFVQKRP